MSEQSTVTRTEISAPLTGIMVPIDQVPDPVFARKMVGDGFSIDPLSNVLVAPVAGEVVDLQPSHHAVTIRTADGLEILMHIGLDTVSLLGTTVSTRPTVPDTCFSTKVTAWRISSVMPKVSTAK